MAQKRLTRQDWTDAGLQALADTGPSALRAEALARDMGTTKGSFYWHFRDLPDYLAVLIAEWEMRAAEEIGAVLESDESLATRLCAFALGGTEPVDMAMRGWARTDKNAARATSTIDKLRMDALHALLADVGITNPDLARALRAAGIGMGALAAQDKADNLQPMATLVDLVLALR